MFDTLKSFLADITSGGRHPTDFDEHEDRLAATALLIHAAEIDGSMSAAERARLTAILRQQFDLDEDGAAELIAAATEAEHASVDLYGFTSVLNRMLDEAGRKRIIEMLWQIVYADGRVSEFEDNMLWRVADLLGISGRQRVELRKRVAAAAGSGSA